MRRLKAVSRQIVATVLYRFGILLMISRICRPCTSERLVKASAAVFPWIQKRTARPIHILMYHGIDDRESPFLPPAPVEQFRNHLQYLSSYCHVLSLEEAVERMQKA